MGTHLKLNKVDKNSSTYTPSIENALQTEGAVSIDNLRPVGDSVIFKRLLQTTQMMASAQCHVLISGPSGSGKKLIAQLLHQQSAHAHAPFINFNCGAFHDYQMEAELFGEDKESVDGTKTEKLGHLTLVNTGTVLLHNVDELSLSLQAKLLEALESRSFKAIGSSVVKTFRGRIIATVQKNLLELVKIGNFREDLYYRLAVITLSTPGLDQRSEDIPHLIEHFNKEQKRPIQFTPEAIDRLKKYTWHGHIQELKNMVEQLSILSESITIYAHTLDEYLIADTPATLSEYELAKKLIDLPGEDKLAATEKLLVEHALYACLGDKASAARLLGVSRTNIERKIQVWEEKKQQVRLCLEHGTQLVDSTRFSAAISVLEDGVNACPATFKNDEERMLRCELYRLLAIAHRGVNGWQSAKALFYYKKALNDARALGKETICISLLFGIWTTQLMSLDLVDAYATAKEMLTRSQHNQDLDLQSQAYLALANTLFWMGKYQETIETLATGYLIPANNSTPSKNQGLDIAALAVTFEGLSAFQLGKFSIAKQAWQFLNDRTLDENIQPFHRVISLQGAAWLSCLFEDEQQLNVLAYDLQTLSEKHHFGFYGGIGQVFKGFHLAMIGQYLEAEKLMCDGFENRMLSEGGKLFHSFQAWKRADALFKSGELEQSEKLAKQAITLSLKQNEQAYLSELLEIRGRTLFALGDLINAEYELRSALLIAKNLGSLIAITGAACSLSKLLVLTGRQTEARHILTQSLKGVEHHRTFSRISLAIQALEELEKSA